MKTVVRRLGVSRGTVILLLLTVASAFLCVKSVPVEAQSGRFIDLFTVKGGIGANQSSDMFQPQELVTFYALVTYNDNPVALKNVGFQVDGPQNQLMNITTTGSSTTNASGVAQFSFRIPWPSENPESQVFGEWFASATVEIADISVVDTLTFHVGWIVEITNIATLDAELKPEVNYLRESTIVFNLTVIDNANSSKPATITIDVQDSASHPIIHIQLDNLLLQPGMNFVNASAVIPSDATPGQATVYAAAYTGPVEQGGVLYSPGTSTTFEIIALPNRPHDVAIIDVNTSPSVAYVGGDIEIMVKAANLGDYDETFNVTAYYNETIIFVTRVASLLPNQTMVIESTWHTLGLEEGTYHIRAEAEVVPDEVNTSNNIFIDGQVTLLSRPPQRLTLFFLLIFMLFFLIVAGLSLILFLVAYFFLRRRKKRRILHSYAVIVHPHI